MGDDEELAELRRLVYGRDADLTADAAALERLAELEGRCVPPSSKMGAEPPPEEMSRSDRAAAESVERAPEDAPSKPAASALRRPSIRRGAVALGVLGGLAFAAGIATFHTAEPRPLVELSAAGILAGVDLPMLTSDERTGIVEAYPAFASLALAVGTEEDAVTSCLLAAADGAGSFEPEVGVCRTRGGGFPLEIIGVVRPAGSTTDGEVALDGPEVDDLPDGTRVRFLLVGDRIEVWLDGAEGHTS